jgi:hypothetical protein
MTSEGLGELVEGDSADTCTRKFPLMSMGGQAEGLAFADPGGRTRVRPEPDYPAGNWNGTGIPLQLNGIRMDFNKNRI